MTLVVNETAQEAVKRDQIYATKTHPGAKPETGKIAVKVINHYGDEVLNVYEVYGEGIFNQEGCLSVEIESFKHDQSVI